MNAITGPGRDPLSTDAPASAATSPSPAPAAPLPSSIPDYLQRLREALHGADPALIQDALYDAEEYLRSEMADNPGQSEAQIIAAVAGSYGAPDEVAEIYRDTEVKVQTALRVPRPAARKSLLGRFFGVALEPRTYGALFYMLLSLATGTFYFTWVNTGIWLSLGLLILIVGVPLLILFLGSVRVLALVEGRLVEVMLGERMPRRPLYGHRDQSMMTRIKHIFVDPHTWGTLLYMLLMLPLGTFYFSVAAIGLSLSLSLIVLPFAQLFGVFGNPLFGDSVLRLDGIDVSSAWAPWVWPTSLLIGIVVLFATLHAARLIGYAHAQLAKHLLVRWAQRD